MIPVAQSRFAEHGPGRALLIEAEQVRTQYRNMPGAFIGSAVIGTLMGLVLQGGLGTPVVAAWLAGVYMQSVARLLLWLQFNRLRPHIVDMRRWGVYAAVGSGISGLVWGCGGLLLYLPGSLSYQAFLLLGILGMASASAYVSASYMPAFLAYAVPALVLSAVPYLLAGDVLHVSGGLLIILFLLFSTRYAFSLCRWFVESTQLRFENVDLIAELRRQKQAAEEASVAKSRFLAAASHDLRQPLHALELFVQTLQESRLPEHEREVVGNIRRAVDAMEDLFNALLDISRLDAGAVQAHVSTFPLASIFERVRSEYGPLAKMKGLSLEVHETSIHVRSDSSLLARIVFNLVANAVRYTDAGRIVVGCRRTSDSVRIEVWDTGRGIPLDKCREIFREFYQVDNVDRDRRRGLGLGLAIVDRLAQLLSHPVQVRSVPDKGSVFSVTVPLGRAEDYTPSETGVDFTSAFDLAHAVVLVVDDELAVRDAMEALLRKWGCRVVTARSGADLLRDIASWQRIPDLIISECRLQEGEDGIELIERLRTEFNADIPAVLITGDTSSQQLKNAETSAMPLLHKPVNPARLRTLIANLLRERARAA